MLTFNAILRHEDFDPNLSDWSAIRTLAIQDA